MRPVTAAFQTELDKKTGAQPRTLLEIDAVGGTLYYSNQTVVVDAQTYSPKVLEFGKLISQIVPGEEVVRVASMSFKLSNIEYIDDQIVAGTEVRVYDWFEGLTAVDKAISFKGTIAGSPSWDDREISFKCNDIFQKFNKIVGQPLLEADWPDADPDYYGRIIPNLIGAGENLECLPIEAGAASTLREDFTPSDTTIKLTSTTSPIIFPTSGTVIIGEVEYTHTGITDDDLTGVPSPSITHPQGSTVLEKTNLKYLAGKSFSDTPVKSITIKGILPFNSNKLADIVAIDAVYYTIDLAELINGNYYATIVLTQINAIRKAVSMAITTQPEYKDHTHPAPSNRTIDYPFDQLKSGTASVGAKCFDGALGEPQTWINYANVYVEGQKVLAQSYDGTPKKVRIKVNSKGSVTGTSIRMRLYWKGTLRIDTTINNKPDTSASTVQSDQYTIPGGDWSDFNDAGTYMRVDITMPGTSTIWIYEAWLEVEYQPSVTDQPTNIVRPTDAVVGGDTVADTLLGRLIVDFEGYQDKSDGHYTGSASALIEKPPDVIHFLWENLSNGAAHADLDIDGSFLDARNNLPASYKFGFALTWQTKLDVLSAQLAQQSHCRFFTSAGLAKFTRILAGGTPAKTIDTDDYSPLTTGDEKKLRVTRFGGAIEKVVNKVEIRYNLNPVLGGKDNPDAYAGNSESLDSAAQSSIDTHGEQRKTWLMWAVRDDTMADDLQAKLLERHRYPRTTTVFPGWATLALMEPSDLITLTADKLRMYGRLSEILQVGNASPVPKNFQAGEVTLTVQDLRFLLISLTDEIGIFDSVKIDIDAALSDSITLSDAVQIDIKSQLIDSITLSDAVQIDIKSQLSDSIGIGDTLTQLKSLWKFDSTRKFDSSKQFNSAP